MKIVIGADAYGAELSRAVQAHLEAAGHACTDLGGDRAYYEVAHDAARTVAGGDADRAVLCCGTGMGMAIVANKHPGVYAAVCETRDAAERARSINNANVLTMGGMVTEPDAAPAIVDAFLDTAFKAGWDEDIQRFLDRSMTDIQSIENDEFGGA